METKAVSNCAFFFHKLHVWQFKVAFARSTLKNLINMKWSLGLCSYDLKLTLQSSFYSSLNLVTVDYLSKFLDSINQFNVQKHYYSQYVFIHLLIIARDLSCLTRYLYSFSAMKQYPVLKV